MTKKAIIAIIVVCCAIAAMLSLGGALRRRTAALLNRFENAVSRQMTAKAAGGAYDTTDHYLKPLEIPHPSETVLKAMAEIPPADAVVFIAAGGDERSDLIHHTISHLCWPRLIGEVRCGAAGAPTELMYLPPAGAPVKWLMFYRVAAPPDLSSSAKMIGPHLILTTASELKEWKSYCSR
ncbi:MAG: hypothetical protein AB7U82_19025 [Blastocatellales bacterium]